MTSALRVEHRDTPLAAVIELHGDVTGDGEDPITEAFASVTSDGPTTVLIVLADTPYINTAGISVLTRLAMQAKRDGHTGCWSAGPAPTTRRCSTSSASRCSSRCSTLAALVSSLAARALAVK